MAVSDETLWLMTCGGVALVACGAAAALLLTRFLLRLHAAQVAEVMSTQRRTAPPSAPATAGGGAGPPRPLPPLRFVAVDHGGPAAASSDAAAELGRRVKSERRWAALLYGAGGSAHVIIVALPFLLGEVTPNTLLEWLSAALVFFFPVYWTVAVVVVASWRWLLGCGLVFLFALAALANTEIWIALAIISIVFLVPTASVGILGRRKWRGVGVPVLIPVSVVIGGAAVGFVAPLVLGITSAPGAAALALAIQYAALVAAAYFTKRLVRRYREKKVNEQTILLDVYWLLLSEWLLTLCIPLILVGEWGFVGPTAVMGAAYVAYLAIPRFGQWCRRRPRRGVRLLLLRVFGSRLREAGASERLLDDVSRHWRYVGSIQLIAAPDVAASTLDPVEIAELVHGRLSGLAIRDADDLERQMEKLDLSPDRDGRFRINEFFCENQIWPEVFKRLVGAADVVLMDLRGVTADNQGVHIELGHLFDSYPVGQVVLLADEAMLPATPEGGETPLQQRVRGLWEKSAALSPNRGAATAGLRVVTAAGRPPGRFARLRSYVRGDDTRATRRLLDALFEAAQPAGARAEEPARTA